MVDTAKESQTRHVDLDSLDFDLLVQAGLGAEPVDTRLTWMPWCRDGDSIRIATTIAPSAELRAEVQNRLGTVKISFHTADADELGTAQELLREKLRFEATERFAEDHPSFSAKGGLLRWQSALPAILAIATIASVVANWRFTIILLFGLGNLAFLSCVGLKLAAAGFLPAHTRREKKMLTPGGHSVPQSPPSPLNDAEGRLPASNHEPENSRGTSDDFPIYTILVPVYREASVVGNIMHTFAALNYPSEKLDVMVLLEASDIETIAAARAANPPAWMRLVIVPEGEPRTKPRACNYGLLLARGKYVVIYDAEDRPEPDQLLKALASFRFAEAQHRRKTHSRSLACVQAALNYYNPDYNVLTRMFSIEYAHWFDSMLPGMDSLDTPMPLGGTSNHFLRSALVKVGGWDPYNVTEDADLGLRLTASGYRVAVVRSTTWEEATAEVMPWIHQRTRWNKGYLMTAAVNLRKPLAWVRRNGLRASLTAFGLLLGTPISFMLYPLTLTFTVLSWLLGPVLQIWLPIDLLIFGNFNMIVMNLLMVISSVVS